MNIRCEFEEIEEIKERLSKYLIYYSEINNRYWSESSSYVTLSFVNGAWIAWQIAKNGVK